MIFDPTEPQITKIELRLTRKLRHKIAPWLPALELESLTDQNVLNSLMRIYDSYTHRMLGLDDFIPSERSRLTTSDYLQYAAEELRIRHVHEHEEVLSDLLDMYQVEQEVRDRIARQLEKERLYLCGNEVHNLIKNVGDEWFEKYPIHADADPAVREFRQKLRKYSNDRKANSIEEKIKRAAQAIKASDTL